MKNQFSKENLEKLGIFELRNLAREIGVYSPTIFKKKDLIEKMLLIVSGEEEPHTPKTKQGRPPKFIHSVNNLLDIFIPKSVSDEVESYEVNYKDIYDYSSLKAMENSDILNYNSQEGQKVKVILEVFEEGYGFCYKKGYKSSNIDENYFISNNMISTYNLKTGDIIEGLVKRITLDKPHILYKVTKINNIEAEHFNKVRKDFNELKAHYPTEQIVFKEEYVNKDVNIKYLNEYLPVGKGQRALVLIQKNMDYSVLITSFLNAIETNNMDTKCMLIDERPEDITEYCNSLKDANIFFTNIEDEPERAIQKIELGLERAKRKVEQEKDVLLVISNLNRLYNLYKKYAAVLNPNEVNAQIDTYTLMMVKKLLSSARKVEEGGSLTIVGFIEENGTNQDLVEQLKELCNMQIVMNHYPYFLKDKLLINILKSESRKQSLLLTEKQLKNNCTLKSVLTEENLEDKTKELEKKLLNR